MGRRLREIRLRAGLTQPELGERAGMAAAEISKIENGRRTPTLETLNRLSHALSVAVEDVVANPSSLDEREQLLSQLLVRLRGQPIEVVRRVNGVVDALIRSG